jgi:hypothetical protein
LRLNLERYTFWWFKEFLVQGAKQLIEVKSASSGADIQIDWLFQYVSEKDQAPVVYRECLLISRCLKQPFFPVNLDEEGQESSGFARFRAECRTSGWSKALKSEVCRGG